MLKRPVYLDEDGNWVAEFCGGEIARSTNKSGIEALLDYAENNLVVDTHEAWTLS